MLADDRAAHRRDVVGASRPPSPRSTCARRCRAAPPRPCSGSVATPSGPRRRPGWRWPSLQPRSSSRPSWPSWPGVRGSTRTTGRPAGGQRRRAGRRGRRAAPTAGRPTAAPPAARRASCAASWPRALGDRPGALADSLGHLARVGRLGPGVPVHQHLAGRRHPRRPPPGAGRRRRQGRPVRGGRVAPRRRALAHGPGRPGRRRASCGGRGGASSTSAAGSSGRCCCSVWSRPWWCRPPARRPSQPVYETLLTACESLVAYRRRYRSDLELDPLCDLLLGDDTNPRSLAFQLDRITEDLAFLPDRRELHQQRRAGRRTPTGPCSARPGWRASRRRRRVAPHLGLQQFVLDARGQPARAGRRRS